MSMHHVYITARWLEDLHPLIRAVSQPRHCIGSSLFSVLPR